MDSEFPVLGYDIGGTKLAVCLGLSSGEILGSERINNYDRNPDEVLREMTVIGDKLLRDAGLKASDLKAIGIDAPSPSDFEKGIIKAPPNNKTWIDVPVCDYIQKHFNVETYLDNDANAAALAEWMFGAGKGHDNMIYLTMSTGVGGGIILNGHLVHGKNFYAGEMGHTVIDINGPMCNCGLRGCYEAFCGGRAMAQRMQKELAGKPEHPVVKFAGGKVEDVNMQALVKALEAKDEYAIALWDEYCMRNAQAFGMFINIFNPEIIVLGTIPTATGELFYKPVREYLPRFCWQESLDACEIKSCALEGKTGEYAGICTALNYLYEYGKWKSHPWG